MFYLVSPKIPLRFKEVISQRQLPSSACVVIPLDHITRSKIISILRYKRVFGSEHPTANYSLAVKLR